MPFHNTRHWTTAVDWVLYSRTCKLQDKFGCYPVTVFTLQISGEEIWDITGDFANLSPVLHYHPPPKVVWSSNIKLDSMLPNVDYRLHLYSTQFSHHFKLGNVISRDVTSTFLGLMVILTIDFSYSLHNIIQPVLHYYIVMQTRKVNRFKGATVCFFRVVVFLPNLEIIVLGEN